MIRPVRRLLLVSHRPIDQAGGPAARWRSFSRHLPEHGWEVDVVSAGGGDEFAAPEKAQRRARVMETAGKLADPVFRLAGLRPEAMPLSMLWVRRGSDEIAPPVGQRPLRRRPRDGAAVRGADRRPPRRSRHAVRRRAARPLGPQPGVRPWRPVAAAARVVGRRTERQPLVGSHAGGRRTTCSGGTPLRASRRSRTASSRRSSRCARRRGRHDDPPFRDADEGSSARAAAAGAPAAASPRAPRLRRARDPRRDRALRRRGRARRSRRAGRTPCAGSPTRTSLSSRRAGAQATRPRSRRRSTSTLRSASRCCADPTAARPRRCSDDSGRPARGTSRRPGVDRGRARQDHGRRPAAARASGEARARTSVRA